MDIDQAMKNPASTFATPEAVSESSELTAEQEPIAMERSAAAIANSGRRGHATSDYPATGQLKQRARPGLHVNELSSVR